MASSLNRIVQAPTASCQLASHSLSSNLRGAASNKASDGQTRLSCSAAAFPSLKAGAQGLVLPAQRAANHAKASIVRRKSSSRKLQAVATSAASVQTTVSWQEIHGSKDWAGLIKEGDPYVVHPQLVKEIVKYGELTQATYDGFIDDSAVEGSGKDGKKDEPSPYTGKNMFNRKELLVASLPPDSLAATYVVEKYLHSSSGFAGLGNRSLITWIVSKISTKRNRDNWAGYVAYNVVDTKDGKDVIEVVVVFRGTQLFPEWVSNIAGVGQRNWLGEGTAKVHNGFQQIYVDDPNLQDDDKWFNQFVKDAKKVAKDSPQDTVRKTIAKLAKEKTVRNIVICGHSLGAALATVCALDVGQFVKSDKEKNFAGYATRPPVSAFVFASPRAFGSPNGEDDKFTIFQDYGVKVLRLTDVPDPITMVPGIYENEKVAAMKSGFVGRAKDGVTYFLDNFTPLPDWVEVGKEIVVDYAKSKILKTEQGKDEDKLTMVFAHHNLEVYLYLISTQLGLQPEPEPGQKPGPGERDYRLCNKTWYTLKPAYVGPENENLWWRTKRFTLFNKNGVPDSDPEEC